MTILREVLQVVTGLPEVTGPAVLIWLAVGLLSLALSSKKLGPFVARYPRLAAFVGVLEALGLDPRKAATNARDALKSKLPKGE